MQVKYYLSTEPVNNNLLLHSSQIAIVVVKLVEKKKGEIYVKR